MDLSFNVLVLSIVIPAFHGVASFLKRIRILKRSCVVGYARLTGRAGLFSAMLQDKCTKGSIPELLHSQLLLSVSRLNLTLKE